MLEGQSRSITLLNEAIPNFNWLLARGGGRLARRGGGPPPIKNLWFLLLKRLTHLKRVKCITDFSN